MGKIIVIFVVIILLAGMIISCAPVKEETPSQVGNMKLLAQQNDIQIWKLIDSISNIFCYVTINTHSYEPAEIFCVNK